MKLDDLRKTLGPAAYDDLRKGIEYEADHDAHRLAHFLSRLRRTAKAVPKDGGGLRPELQCMPVLLAMLPKILRWNDQGFAAHSDERPPDPAEAFDVIKRLLDDSFDDASLALCRKTVVNTLVYWAKNCSWAARRFLGVEVALRRPSVVMARVDDVADYLQTHRRIARDERGGNHADS